MPAPPAYSDNGHNGNWSVATPADTAIRGDWWAIYQDAQLNDLEQRCANANQNIAAAFHAYEQAHDLVRENKASLYPTVSIGAAATRNRISDNRPLHTPGTATNYWDFLIPVNISWEPDFWGGIRRQIESSAASAQATAADLANIRLSLQGMLAVTYFQMRGLDLQAQLLRSTLDSYQQSLDLTQFRFKGGLASDSDVEQARTLLEQTRAQLIDLGVQRAQFEHAIAVLIGEPATNFHIAENPLVGDPPSVPTGIPSELLQRRPDIAGAERRVASANALIGVAKSAFYPNITLGASGGVESDTDQPALQRRQRRMERRSLSKRDSLRCRPPEGAARPRSRPARTGHCSLPPAGALCISRCRGPARRTARARTGGSGNGTSRHRCETQHGALHACAINAASLHTSKS